jgi:phosphoribosylformylglycinamidine synthase
MHAAALCPCPALAHLQILLEASLTLARLQIPSHPLEWEDASEAYPPALAPPLQILLEASDGASDYGNKFGEPLVAGYTRSFGLRLPGEERREWIKPIMFSGGFGQIDRAHHHKHPPEVRGGLRALRVRAPLPCGEAGFTATLRSVPEPSGCR